MQLAEKKVLVVGLGVSGNAAARLCLQKGARVRATDIKMDTEQANQLSSLGAVLTLGAHRQEDFAWADIIVLSPGVDNRQPLIQQAQADGKLVIGEMELAFSFIPCPSIMVTGSNGKTTVCTLLAEIMQAAGHQVFAGGNLGVPLSQLIIDKVVPDWAVLEVSSFQTDTSRNLKPRIGIILNLQPDHMDRYATFEDYANSKFSMLQNQQGDDLAILCSDDPRVAARVNLAPALVVRYGLDYPKLDSSAWLQGNFMVIRLPDRDPVMIDIAGNQLVGGFNRLNLLAVAAACLYAGVEPELIRQHITQFPGLPHRLVKVGQINEISFYDDSKATNVGAVQAALGAVPQASVLLLGGRDKAGIFIQLLPELLQYAVGVVCFGEAGPDIYQQLKDVFPCQLADDLASAVNIAYRIASPGQAVLLSPGCASFDAYTGYAQRGDHFIQLVKELSACQ